MKLNIVPARTGLLWVKLGIRTFFRQPLALSGLFLLSMALMSLLAVVPVVGSALALALLPLITLAMMAAAQQVALTPGPRPGVLKAGVRALRAHPASQAVLGGLYALGFVLMLAVSAAFDGGAFAKLYLLGGTLTREVLLAPGLQLALWAATLLYVPLSMLFWHAPGLVHWHGVPPAKSLFFSIVACLRNMGAFTVFGLAWLGVFLAVGMTVGVLTTLLLVSGVFGAADSTTGAAMAGGILVGAALVLAAMFFCSIYFTFRDCFQPDDAKEPSDEPTPPAGAH